MRQKDYSNAIKKVITKHLDPRETLIFLFGSRAHAINQRTSDYDVGVYQEKKIPLALIGKINNDLCDTSIPVDVDIVDFFATTPDFRRVALKDVKIWNKPKRNFKLI